MKLKYHCRLLFCILMLLPSAGMAQSQEQAKKLFNEGQYAEAKPMFEKLLKKNPRNGNLNYWYGACCYETGETDKCLPHLKVAAERKVREAHRYLAMCHADSYRYAEAEESWENYIALMERAKKPTDEYLPAYDLASLGRQMMRSVQDICFIDSFVVDKAGFLTTYRLSPEAGSLTAYNAFFNEQAQPDGVVYQTEMKNKLYYSARSNDGQMHLYASDLIGDRWGNGTPLNGLPDKEDTNYPYMLSDGTTFYYAAKGEGSLGGYDIYVTRYDSEEDRFLVPENIGMPFNSPANDYMFVIDEFNGLGWFATDRHQPEDKVCIYVFLHNEGNSMLNEEKMLPEVLQSRARLASIKDTWTDENAVRKGKQQLASCIYSQPEAGKRHDFTFIIDDLTVYHTLNDFRSPKARELFTHRQQELKKLDSLSRKLEEKRTEYARSNEQQRLRLTTPILELEQQVETLETSIDRMDTDIRNAEIGTK